jgi:AcrR family transcriptional regulator
LSACNRIRGHRRGRWYRSSDFNFKKDAVPQPRQARNGRSNNRGAPSSRSKRAAILETATELFGREGYEDSKWADVAKSVGIGSTALYHYFESKLHCLYEIMAEALETEVARFERITGEHEEFEDALVAVLTEAFDLLARAILGLYNSVFHWYRPRAGLALSEVAEFYVPRCLAVAGVPLEGATGKRTRASRSRAAKR